MLQGRWRCGSESQFVGSPLEAVAAVPRRPGEHPGFIEGEAVVGRVPTHHQRHEEACGGRHGFKARPGARRVFWLGRAAGCGGIALCGSGSPVNTECWHHHGNADLIKTCAAFGSRRRHLRIVDGVINIRPQGWAAKK